MNPRSTVAAACASLCLLLSCSPNPGASGAAAPPTAVPAAPAASPAVPTPRPTPPPGIHGRFSEVNVGTFALVDGIAWSAKGGAGTVVYATSKDIASAALASSPCPMTMARALTSIRDAGWVEITLDVRGKSKYFSAGTPFGGTSREEDVGGRYWDSWLTLADGRAIGDVEHTHNGGFEFNVPVLTPRVSEVSESDKIGGKRSDPSGVSPTEAQVVAAYQKMRAAALKKDLAAMLRAEGFDDRQIEAVRKLDGIGADLAVYADRFLKPGKPGEFQNAPGQGAVRTEGTNSKKAKFINYYSFTPCEGRLVLTNIYENPQ